MEYQYQQQQPLDASQQTYDQTSIYDTQQVPPQSQGMATWKKVVIGLGVLIILLLIAGGIWWLVSSKSDQSAPKRLISGIFMFQGDSYPISIPYEVTASNPTFPKMQAFKGKGKDEFGVFNVVGGIDKLPPHAKSDSIQLLMRKEYENGNAYNYAAKSKFMTAIGIKDKGGKTFNITERQVFQGVWTHAAGGTGDNFTIIIE